MADHYAQLTEAEKAHWDEYTRLRELSDWAGFTDAQDQRRADSRDWLVNQRKEIWRSAEGKKDGVTPGWDVNQRSQRYAQLSDDSLNGGSCRRVASLPRNNSTDAEKALLAERCVWWMVSSTTDAQKARKQACTDWLIDRRKQVYGLIQDNSDADNDANARSTRYANLSIATKSGDAYTNWLKTHDATTGQPKGSSSGKSSRSKVKDWLDSFIGVHENPDGSNKGSPQPTKWQQRVYGDDGVPWCACFAVCSSWDNGASGSGTAGVANNVDLAKQGKGIYRGWTNDPSRVHAGDHAFIGADHTGVIYDADSGTTVEGNTSASGGSQWNGGQVAKKTRGWSYWSAGFGLVDFPDD